MVDMRLNSKQIKYIEKWLELKPRYRSSVCPFSWFGKGFECAVCKELFPKIVNEFKDKIACPCIVYSKKYVYQKTKKFIKDNK